ncbi:MAG: arginase family protein [Candidatus Woesearchaeota archaeon]
MKINILKAKVSKGALSKSSNGLLNAPDEIEKEIYENIFGSIYLKNPSISFNFYEVNENDTIDRTLNLIEEEIIKKDIDATIGGNHVISYATIKSFKKKYPYGKVIIFDAHPDVESDFFISHEDYLRILINEKILKNKDVILIGLRNASNEELKFLKSKKIKYFSAKDVYFNEKKVINFLSKLKGPCFISIDIDVFDPSFAPGTGYIESFGISPFQFLKIIEALKDIRMFDIIEINCEKDIKRITINLAARIIYELCIKIKKENFK